MEIYIKTDNIYAAKNTALSAKAVMDCEIVLDSPKKVKSDLWELGEVEDETLQAGDIVLAKWSKKIKVFKGEELAMSAKEAMKGYHVFRLTSKTLPRWVDWYNRKAKSIGGHSTQFV